MIKIYSASPLLIVLMIFTLVGNINQQTKFRAKKPLQVNDSIFLADPTIFYERGVYYLYGTGGNNGFQVYSSTDMYNWKGPVGHSNGYALIKGESYGTSGFWAPQVFRHKGKYYMAYTANENIAIAQSESPLGPFKQEKLVAISGNGKQIDPYIFFDTRGRIYLYHVRLTNGNRIYVAEMKNDLSDIIQGSEKECIAASEPWENTKQAPWPVAEGPTVMKIGGQYYMFYSANDFRNIDYAMGYAISKSPLGPWTKHVDNPVLSRHNTGVHGTGHGDFIKKDGALYYVFHTHRSSGKVSPRLTAIIRCHFSKAANGVFKVVADPGTFSFLRLKL